MVDKNQMIYEVYENVIKEAETYKQTVEGCGRTVGSNIITHMKSLDTLADKDPSMIKHISNYFVGNLNAQYDDLIKKEVSDSTIRGIVIGAVGTLVVAGAGKFIFNRIKNRKKSDDHYIEVSDDYEDSTYIDLDIVKDFEEKEK